MAYDASWGPGAVRATDDGPYLAQEQSSGPETALMAAHDSGMQTTPEMQLGDAPG
jgi:hypothetical protein